MTDDAARPRPQRLPGVMTSAQAPQRRTRRPGCSLPGVLVRLPVLTPQVLAVRRTTPRLPAATGRDGVASTIPRHERTGEPLEEHHLVVLGDSVADGVGIDHHRNSIAGRLACRMSEKLEHAVAWHVIARSGADASEALRLTRTPEAQARLREADAIVISTGVNDVKNLRTEAAWRQSLTTLLEDVTTLAGDTPVILLGVPPMNEFPAMPRGLGDVLGRRCERFDAIADEVAANWPTVRRLPLTDSKLIRAKAFGDDGFHPSPWLHKKIAKQIAAQLDAACTVT